MLQYHHSRSLDGVVFDSVVADPSRSDSHLRGAYEWLEQEVGFYPLFLAVGVDEDDLRMTGYQDNWRVRTSLRYEDGKRKGTYRGKGEFLNNVLFSFEDVGGVFMDFDSWHIALNSAPDYDLTDYQKRLIFKPSWSMADWLRSARKETHSVQLVVPELYLPDAGRILVRNRKTKKGLESMGFENVEVGRITLDGE
jgi:hypothetical protein